jgi:hypothetical protein
MLDGLVLVFSKRTIYNYEFLTKLYFIKYSLHKRNEICIQWKVASIGQ